MTGLKTVLVPALASLLACQDAELGGNGVVGSVERSPAPFSSVVVENGLPARIEPGENRVQLTFDENLFDSIETSTTGSTLHVRTSGDRDVTWSVGSVASIHAPELSSVQLSGGSETDATVNAASSVLLLSGGSRVRGRAPGVSALRVEESGGSRVEMLEGAFEDLSIVATGGSTFAGSARTKRASIEATGGSEVALEVSEAIRIRASGASRIVVRGEPSARDVELTGDATATFVP